MNRKKSVITVWLTIILVTNFLVGIDFSLLNLSSPTGQAEGANIIVDGNGGQDYARIQAGVNNANPGDTIYVWPGTYNENIEINKAVTIIGDGSSTTIINGGGFGDVVSITSDWVNMSGFTVKNGGGDGIELNDVDNCIIEKNVCITNNEDGIRLISSSNNIILNNTCVSNAEKGIHLYLTQSENNMIRENVCSDNDYGIFICSNNNTVVRNTINSNTNYGVNIYAGSNNLVYHNNFISNNGTGVQAFDDGTDNWWNETYQEGNYWADELSRYPTAQNNGKYWDIPYEVRGSAGIKDFYPLAYPLFLITDNSPTAGTTGDPFVFDIKASGILTFASINITWEHAYLRGNDAMNDDGDLTWSLTVILAHSLTNMVYSIQVNDSFGGYFKLLPSSVTVTDNDKPVIDQDNSANQGFTGDFFFFDVKVSDNILVAKVNVTWSHGQYGGNVIMDNDWDGTWSLIIQLDHTVSVMIYSIQVTDSSGNFFRQVIQIITIWDNDKPILVKDDTPNNGTTGDSFRFNITTSDNILVDAVHILWVHAELNGNLSLTLVGGHWIGTIILDHSIAKMNYIIFIRDAQNNFFISPLISVVVIDNDFPVAGPQWNCTLISGYRAFFSINITENVGLSMIMFSFVINGMVHFNWSVTNRTGNSWFIIFILPSYTVNIKFFFWIKDTSANIIWTNFIIRTAIDIDGPTFIQTWHSEGTTGDPMVFAVLLFDNIAVSRVYFSFAIDGRWYNWSVSNHTDNRWEITIIAPQYQITIQYFFIAVDISNNWNLTIKKNAEVTDNDKPVFIEDLTEGYPTTGDPFLIKIRATDNILIERLEIWYTFNGFVISEKAMTLHIDGYWFREIDVPSNGLYLNYSFYLRDEAWNILITHNIYRKVIDNDKPDFLDLTSGIPTTGGQFTISVSVIDNIAIRTVNVIYAFNDTEINVSMERTRAVGWSIWTITIEIPVWATYLKYHFFISDTSYNNLTTPASSLDVLDIVKPIARPGTDITIDQYITIMLNGSLSSDNIMVMNYTWTFVYDGSTYIFHGMIAAFTFVIVGVYNIVLNVTDNMGNWDTDIVVVTVVDITPPTAVAGKDINIEQGGKVVFDGRASRDNVGITIYKWKFTVQGNEIILMGGAVSFTFYTAGNFNITLTVFDGAGNFDVDHLVVVVADISLPIAHAGENQTRPQGWKVIFNASHSTDNVGIRTYSWKVKYEGNYYTLIGMTSSFTFNTPGIYNVELTVTDLVGNSAKDSVTITIIDITRPIAYIYINDFEIKIGDRFEITINQNADIDGSKSTDNVGIVVYKWTLEHASGNHTTYASRIENYNFNHVGTYTVTLNVSDVQGNTDTKSVQVEVKEEENKGAGEEGGSGGGTFFGWAGGNSCLLLFLGLLILFILLLAILVWWRDEEKAVVKEVPIMKVRRHIRKRRARPGAAGGWMAGGYGRDRHHLKEYAHTKEVLRERDVEKVIHKENTMVEKKMVEGKMKEKRRGKRKGKRRGGRKMALALAPTSREKSDAATIKELEKKLEAYQELEKIFKDSGSEVKLVKQGETQVLEVEQKEVVVHKEVESSMSTFQHEEMMAHEEEYYDGIKHSEGRVLKEGKRRSSKVRRDDVKMLGGGGNGLTIIEPEETFALDELEPMEEYGEDEEEVKGKIEKKGCPECGKIIDHFWAVCPHCKKPL